MKEHEHKYISGTIGDQCEFCGLLKSTIEATEYTPGPTVLSVLKECRDILARMETILLYKSPFPADIPKEAKKHFDPSKYFCITDDGKTKTSELFAQCKAKFPIVCFLDTEDLDNYFPTLKKETTRYFKKEVEASDEKSKSWNDLPDPENYCTLRERLLMELQYFDETGKHLDVNNWTLCAGSRRADGDVPIVCLYGDGFVHVYCWDPGRASGRLRFRRAISL